jgi:uncharacterized phage-like protein YoqJ
VRYNPDTLNPEQLYNPLLESGNALPDIKTVRDSTFFIQRDGDIRKFFVAFDGDWLKLNLTRDDVLEIDTILATNLYASKFTAKEIRATNGALIVSDEATVESVDGNVIRFKDDSGFNVCPFQADDLIIAREINKSTDLDIRYVKATVTSVKGNMATVVYTSTSVFKKGDTVVRVGSTSETDRQDSLYFTTMDNGSPYFDVYDQISAFTGATPTYKNWDSHIPKVRVGKLSEIIDADFNSVAPYKLTGYGAYIQNLYAKGSIYLGDNGSLSLGKKAWDDATHAGFWLGDSDSDLVDINPYLYFGNGVDGVTPESKYLKIDTIAGTFKTLGFEITGGKFQTDSGEADHYQRVVIDGTANDIEFYDSANNKVGTITGTFASPLSILDIRSSHVIDITAGIYTRVNGLLTIIDGAIDAGINLNSKFQVDDVGNLIKINDVTYSFPSTPPALNEVLTCTNATGGILSWEPAGSGSIAWGSVTGKPFSTVGYGLEVVDDAIKIDFTPLGTHGNEAHTSAYITDVSWDEIGSRPFSTIGYGLEVVDNAIKIDFTPFTSGDQNWTATNVSTVGGGLQVVDETISIDFTPFTAGDQNWTATNVSTVGGGLEVVDGTISIDFTPFTAGDQNWTATNVSTVGGGLEVVDGTISIDFTPFTAGDQNWTATNVSTIGGGLDVTDGTISVEFPDYSTTYAPYSHSHAWSAITSKPFSTIGGGLEVVDDVLKIDFTPYTPSGVTQNFEFYDELTSNIVQLSFVNGILTSVA